MVCIQQVLIQQKVLWPEFANSTTSPMSMLFTYFISVLKGTILGISHPSIIWFFLFLLSPVWIISQLLRMLVYFLFPISPPSYNTRILRIWFDWLNSYSLHLPLAIAGKAFSIHTLDWEIYAFVWDVDAVPNKVVHNPSFTDFESPRFGLVFVAQWTDLTAANIFFFRHYKIPKCCLPFLVVLHCKYYLSISQDNLL